MQALSPEFLAAIALGAAALLALVSSTGEDENQAWGDDPAVVAILSGMSL